MTDEIHHNKGGDKTSENSKQTNTLVPGAAENLNSLIFFKYLFKYPLREC